MGQSKSKALPHPQYALHPGYPQYGHVYPYPVVPQVAYPPGYHAPVIPPGYGPVVIPPPPTTESNSRRKKKEKQSSSSGGRKHRSTSHKRHRSEPLNVQPMPPGILDNLPVGFIPNNIIPNIPGGTNPVIPQAPHATTAQEPPIRRAPTPWVNSVPSDTSDEEDESHHHTSHHRSRSVPRHRTHSRYRRDPRREISPDDPIAAIEPRAPNPLPDPPRDIFSSSPYQHFLRPTDGAALPSMTQNRNVGYDPSKAAMSRSGTLPGIAGVGAGINAALPRMKKKGLFSFGSLRNRRNPANAPEYAHGYAPAVYPNMSQSRSAPGSAPAVGFNDASRAGSPPARRSPSVDDDETTDEGHLPPPAHRPTTPGPSHPYPQSGQIYSQPHPSQSQPPVLSPSQPFLFSPNGSTIEFSQRSLPEFLNHSSHRVMYGNKTYPTAMHLHEAMKFLDHKPDLAETIRQCEKIEDVYPAALSFQVWVRPDWGTVFLDKMEEVLWAKFTQHPDLRSTLLKTGDCRIVYADTQDSYWGSGSDIGHPGNYTGYNYLGKLLEKVRDRLRMEGYSA